MKRLQESKGQAGGTTPLPSAPSDQGTSGRERQTTKNPCCSQIREPLPLPRPWPLAGGRALRVAAAALGADVPGEPVHKELNPASPDCEFSASLPHAAKQQLDIFHPSRERQRREDIPMIPFCMPNYELRCSSICPGPASST